MLDVMHFGTPLWLKQAVGDPEFPEALEAIRRSDRQPLLRFRENLVPVQ